jgi:molybdopterin-guanine dinucleotide biosynthesis protein A
MKLSGFILAGGKSSRMGRDKALLNWHGRTLLEHMVGLVRTVADPVLVIGRESLPDRLPGLGPLAGIATGLETTFTDANLFVAVDLPFLTEDFLIFLRSRIEASSQPLLVCKIGTSFPLCIGVWRPMLPEIQRRLNTRERSIRSWIEGGGVEIIDGSEIAHLGFDLLMFRNINTEKDYQSALDLSM